MTGSNAHSRQAALGQIVSAVVPGLPSSSTDCVSHLDNLRLTCLATQLRLRLVTSPPDQRDENVAAWSELPLDGAARLLRAPALCELLRSDGDVRELRKLMRIETIFATTAEAYVDEWSSLGDVWLGARAPANIAGFTLSGNRYVSRSLSCGTPLDLSLPAAVGRPSAGLRRPRLPTENEIGAALLVIDEALDILATAAPLGYAMFEALASNIVLREDEERAEESWGATSGVVIGRIVLVNAARATPALMAEYLLHEITHCALDCAELNTPLLRRGCRFDDDGFRSPWTGNLLPLHAYLHASAVWAVLAEYWSNYSDLYDASEAVPRRHFIAKGFAQASPDAFLRHEAVLSEGALILIDRSLKIGQRMSAA